MIAIFDKIYDEAYTVGQIVATSTTIDENSKKNSDENFTLPQWMEAGRKQIIIPIDIHLTVEEQQRVEKYINEQYYFCHIEISFVSGYIYTNVYLQPKG